jgi:hypothetical protein
MFPATTHPGGLWNVLNYISGFFFLGFSEWSNLGSFSRQSLGFTRILSHFLIIVYVDTHMSIFFFSFLLS